MKKIAMYTAQVLSVLSSASCSYFKIPEKTGKKAGNICTYTTKGEFVGCEPIK